MCTSCAPASASSAAHSNALCLPPTISTDFPVALEGSAKSSVCETMSAGSPAASSGMCGKQEYPIAITTVRARTVVPYVGRSKEPVIATIEPFDMQWLWLQLRGGAEPLHVVEIGRDWKRRDLFAADSRLAMKRSMVSFALGVEMPVPR